MEAAADMINVSMAKLRVDFNRCLLVMYYEKLTARVESNIIAVYAAIHKLGVVHSDIRLEKVLVLKDD